MPSESSLGDSACPLLDDSPESWDQLIATANPASILVAIDGLLSTRLAGWVTAQDVWQETLLVAWRSRASLEWRGHAAFRRWLMVIARNRIRDIAEASRTQKLGAGRERLFCDLPRSDASSDCVEHYAGPVRSTTPSRVASDRELATQLQAALHEVPRDWREAFRLRLFEDQSLEEIAERCGLGVEGVRYRIRRAAEVYRRALRRIRWSGSAESSG